MYKLLDEDEKSFTIDKGGKKFKVAKKAISPRFHESIRKYCSGGHVKGYAEGGVVEADFDPVEQARKEIFEQESRSGKVDTSRTNNRGATGPMQVTKATFEGLKKNKRIPNEYDINNPDHNVQAGHALINEIAETPKIKKITDPQKKLEAIKGAYYSGPKAITKNGDIIPMRDPINKSAPNTVDYAKNRPLSSEQVPFYSRQASQDVNVAQGLQFNPQAPATNSQTDYPLVGQDEMNRQFTNRMMESPMAGSLSGEPNYPNMTNNAFNQQGMSAQAPVPPGEFSSQQIARMQNYNPQGSPIEGQISRDQAAQQQAVGQLGMQKASSPAQYPSFNGPSPYDDYFNAQSDAINAGAEAQQTAARGQADIYGQMANQQAQMQQNYKSLVDNMNKEIDDFAQQYKNQRLDPNRLYASQSTGDKLLSGIALIISGMGAGLTGQPNLALQVMDKAIDRDIEAQKYNIDKGENLLSLQMKKYGNLMQAEMATKEMMMSQANSKLQQAIENAKSPQIAAQAKAAQAELKLNIMKVRMDLRNMMADTQALTGFGTIPMFSPQHLSVVARNPKMAETQVIDKTKGVVYFAPDKETRERVNNYVSSTDDVLKTLKELKDYTKASMIPTTKEYHSMKQKLSRARQLYATLESSGVGSTRLSELENVWATEIIPDRTKISNFYTDELLDELISEIQQSKEIKLNALLPGYVPQVFETTKKKATARR